MKALTVQQPWAWAIMHGGKSIENRTQLWSYRGSLAIHAGLRWSDRGARDPRVNRAIADRLSQTDKITENAIRIAGAILGTVELVDVHHDAGCCKPWGEHGEVETTRSRSNRERYGTRDVSHRTITHLVLKDPRPLAVPIGCTGALGLWAPPSDVLEQLHRHVTA